MTEDDFRRIIGGVQTNHNSHNVVFSYVVNFNINGADANSIDQIKSLLDYAASLQKKGEKTDE